MSTIIISHYNSRPIQLSAEKNITRVQPIAYEFVEDTVNCDPLTLLLAEELEEDYVINNVSNFYTH